MDLRDVVALGREYGGDEFVLAGGAPNVAVVRENALVRRDHEVKAPMGRGCAEAKKDRRRIRYGQRMGS